MNIKRFLMYTMLLSVITTGFCSCKNNNSVEQEQSSSQEVVTESEKTEEPVSAGSGDAFLAITDGQRWVQYWGNTDDDGHMLSYGAGIAHIDGDGEYTVSVNCDTAGFRYDITGSADGEYTPAGLGFAAVKVNEGKVLYPDMSIEITSIRVDEKEVPITAKNYTNSDDGVEMRANIYNEWVSQLPDDAHNSEGTVTEADGYSPVILDKSAFSNGWTEVEVSFRVTGTE